MSDALAIAAVTATLKLLLAGDVGEIDGAVVTTRPPDRMTPNGGKHQVNLFLYQTSIDAAWRNEDMPGVTPGETAWPPLPLSLHYLVTPYPLDDDEVAGQKLLGRAMSVLHDHPLLGSEEIRKALGDSDLDEQVERVRITPQPMTLEEMSKLWTTFQTQYRTSAAYQACVVLISSRRAAVTPAPVLARNAGDTGPIAVASPVAPIPTIGALELPRRQPSAVLGDEVTLRGHDLAAMAKVVIAHPRLAAPLERPVAEAAPDHVSFRLPDAPDLLPAGVCTVRAVPDDPAEDLSTPDVALPVAPRVRNQHAARDPAGAVRIGLDVEPHVFPGQKVFLVLDRAVPLGPVAAGEGRLDFAVGKLAAGEHVVRLRVDGVDSQFIDREQAPPVFVGKVDVP